MRWSSEEGQAGQDSRPKCAPVASGGGKRRRLPRLGDDDGVTGGAIICEDIYVEWDAFEVNPTTLGYEPRVRKPQYKL